MSCVRLGPVGLHDVLGSAPAVAATEGPRLDVCRDARGYTYCPSALAVRVSSSGDCARLCRVLNGRLRAVSGATVILTCEVRQRSSAQAPAPVSGKFVVAFLACEPTARTSLIAPTAGATSTGLAWHAVRDCVEALRVGNPYTPYRRSTVTYFLQV